MHATLLYPKYALLCMLCTGMSLPALSQQLASHQDQHPYLNQRAEQQAGQFLPELLTPLPPEAETPMATVTGTVTAEANGGGLPGVNVLVKGSSTGTVTDIEGNYSINVPNEDDILVFSSIGFITQEVPVNGKTVLDVALAEDIQSLEEIVVIGYGTQKQREVTGSIATLEAAQLEDQPVGQFAQKIQGRIAGVQINQSSGTPGGGMSVRIRGAASINAGNSPLYVIDGFPIVGDINTINPNEIESFSVLKGASAAALYGSRAANGVDHHH